MALILGGNSEIGAQVLSNLNLFCLRHSFRSTAVANMKFILKIGLFSFTRAICFMSYHLIQVPCYRESKKLAIFQDKNSTISNFSALHGCAWSLFTSPVSLTASPSLNLSILCCPFLSFLFSLSQDIIFVLIAEFRFGECFRLCNQNSVNFYA